MTKKHHYCAADDVHPDEWHRRQFLQAAGKAAAMTAVGASVVGLPATATKTIAATPETATPETATPETDVKRLYDSLTEDQKQAICFDWNHNDPERGLLRTRVSNNWRITSQYVLSDFYTRDQQDLVRAIFEGIIDPEWHDRVTKQLSDDSRGPFGNRQSVAIFGKPGNGKFEFVMTGRHMTLRCDGNSADHVAFGGPIFYGHAAGGFNESADHSGNVYWEQAVVANQVFDMLSGKQREQALIDGRPEESEVGFRGAEDRFDGIPVAELSADQQEHVQSVLQKLIEPYRQSDRDEVVACLQAQGGLQRCHLAFYRDGDIGDDQVWDNWRLEGPAFVWYFRGSPHVHVWVNVADEPGVILNA